MQRQSYTVKNKFHFNYYYPMKCQLKFIKDKIFYIVNLCKPSLYHRIFLTVFLLLFLYFEQKESAISLVISPEGW